MTSRRSVLRALRLYIKKRDLISSHLRSPRLGALVVVALGFCLVVHAHIDMTHVSEPRERRRQLA